MSDNTLPPLQLGQALTMLSACVRELTTQVGELRTEIANLSARVDRDREGLRTFTRDVKNALREAAASESQELRAARIETPLPPPLPVKHGRTRP